MGLPVCWERGEEGSLQLGRSDREPVSHKRRNELAVVELSGLVTQLVLEPNPQVSEFPEETG